MRNDQADQTGWGTDTPISMPVPPTEQIWTDFGTFGFTQYGIAHNITSGDLMNFLPTYLPATNND